MHTEKDYLKVATAQTEQEALDKHWEIVKRMKIWTSSEGEKTHFKDLEASHLITIIKMLVRFYGERPSQPLKELINVLLEEIKMRLKMKNSKETAQPLMKRTIEQKIGAFAFVETTECCSNCGRQILDPKHYCPYCGQKIGAQKDGAMGN